MTAENGDSGSLEESELTTPDETAGDFTASSILHGLRATAAHMLAEARAEARRAQEEAWRRYESKTKHRRDED